MKKQFTPPVSSKVKPNKGFTLAEVLITLVIIGVIAALTIPTVIANSQKHETEARLKKFQSTLTQAVRLTEIDNGGFYLEDAVDSSSIPRNNKPNGSGTPEDWWNNVFGKHLPVTKQDGYKIKDSPSDGTIFNPKTVYVLNDGTTIIHFSYYTCGSTHCRLNLYYDTNGEKGPNQINKDIFPFTIEEFHNKTNDIHVNKVCLGHDCKDNACCGDS